MTQFNFNIETSNGFKGNVKVEKHYDGSLDLVKFYAEVETSFGIIPYFFDERDVFDTSIKSVKDYVIMSLELDIDSILERSKKQLGVKCNTFREYEIAFFGYTIDVVLNNMYTSRIINRETYEKATDIKSTMKFDKYGDSVRMVDEDGNWWDDVDEAIDAILEKAGYMVYESDDDE